MITVKSMLEVLILTFDIVIDIVIDIDIDF